jgi:hypothetical protein
MNLLLSKSWKPWLLVALGLAVLLPAGLGAGNDGKRNKERNSPEVFDLCTLLEQEKKDAHWDRLFDLVAAIQKDVEAKAGQPPYKDLKAMVKVAEHRKLPLAKPGLHSRWSSARHASKTPPGPGGTYINTAVAVMPSSLTNQVPKNIVVRDEKNGPRSEVWDGYISKSIVVVDGTVLTTSYIYDSIVIAAGPIRIDGYINNSLVISVGSCGPSLVDVEDGYLSNCVVVGELVTAGYAHESLVFGKLRSDSLRGADVRDHSHVADIPWRARATESSER